MDKFLYISTQEVVEFINRNIKNILSPKEIKLKDNTRTFRRDWIEIYSSEENLFQNRLWGSTLNRVFNIRSNKKIKSLIFDLDNWDKKTTETIIIFESILVDVDDIGNELVTFLENIVELSIKISIRFLSFVMTNKVKSELVRILEEHKFIHYDIIIINEVEDIDVKPLLLDNNVLDDKNMTNEAIGFLRRQDRTISDSQVLVLFEKFCPKQSISIFWNKELGNFSPLFPLELKKRDKKDNIKILKNENYREKIDRLDSMITEIEEWLRELIVSILQNEKEIKTFQDLTNREFILESINRKIKKELKTHPYKKKEDLIKIEQAIEYTDLSNLEIIICSRRHYPFFEELFGEKRNFQNRFSQLLEFRNCKRHSRREVNQSNEKKIDSLIINDGEASVTWFNRIKESNLTKSFM